MGSYLHETMAIPAVHTKLLHVKIMLERHRLGRLVTNARVFGSELVGDAAGNCRAEHNNAHRQLPGKLIRPLREEICHRSEAVSGCLRLTTDELRETRFHNRNGNCFFSNKNAKFACS